MNLSSKDSMRAEAWLVCVAVPLLLSFDPILSSPVVLGTGLSRAARGLHDILLFGMGLVVARRVIRGDVVLPGPLGVATWVYLAAAAASLVGLVGTPLFEFEYLQVVLTGLITWALVVGVLAPELGTEVRRKALALALVARTVAFGAYRLHAVLTVPGAAPRVTPFGHLNASAGYAAISVPLLVGLLLQSRRWSSRCVVGAALLIATMSLLTTGSRGAVLALVVGAVAAVSLARGSRAGTAVAAVLALGLLLAPLSVSRRMSTVLRPSHPTNVFRVDLWRNVMEVASRKPLLGVGYGSLWYFYRPYLDAGSEALPGGHAHNVILHTLAETGVVGLLALSCLVALAVLRAWRWWKASRSWLALGVMSSLLVMVAHGAVDTVFREYHVQVFFWGLIALVSSSGTMKNDQ